MLTIIDLLEDPIYKAYFCKVPKLPKTSSTTPPWRLYIQRKGETRWRRRDFDTYSAAFKVLKKLLKEDKVKDAAIHCRRMSFAPPVRMMKIRGKYVRGSDGVSRQATKRVDWEPKIPADIFDEHEWCPWCRRPSVFKYYSRHHALGQLGMTIDPSVPRCVICGASVRIATYRSIA